MESRIATEFKMKWLVRSERRWTKLDWKELLQNWSLIGNEGYSHSIRLHAIPQRKRETSALHPGWVNSPFVFSTIQDSHLRNWNAGKSNLGRPRGRRTLYFWSTTPRPIRHMNLLHLSMQTNIWFVFCVKTQEIRDKLLRGEISLSLIRSPSPSPFEVLRL